MKLHMELDGVESCPVGRDPRSMTAEELEQLGHHKRPLLAVIRENCLHCCCGNQAEVRRCGMFTCPMWPYRMNSNPFAAPVSDEQRERARENLKRARLSAERPTPSGANGIEASGGIQIANASAPKPSNHSGGAAAAQDGALIVGKQA